MVRKFAQTGKSLYLCSAKTEESLLRLKVFCITYAKIAQLVEHNLAKVGVAGSSPVFRSRLTLASYGCTLCPGGGIGRHATLRG